MEDKDKIKEVTLGEKGESDKDKPEEKPEEKPKEKKKLEPKKFLKRAWHFLWHEESALSYVAFIIITFLILRFVAFPGFLFVSGYSDVAAVISTSMEHGELINNTFYEWLQFHNYSTEDIENWPYLDGLNVGDVIAVKKVPASEIRVGDIILFYAPQGQIIHRVMYVYELNEKYFYTTKGDANPLISDMEKDIPYEEVKGKLVGKVPYLGWPRVAVTYIIPTI